jgi:hypothetical protein
MADVMESCVVSQPTKRRLRRQPQGARPTRRGQTHDTEIATNKGAAGGSLSPGACQLYVRPDGDRGGTATVQLAAGTQTFLEVQSLRSWAGAGGDHFQRDTLYVRAISAYWAEKYFPTLTYLGPR